VTEILTNYGLFAAKLVTIIVAILFLCGLLFSMWSHARQSDEVHLKVRSLNQKYDEMRTALSAATLPRKAFKQVLKQIKGRRKQEEQQPGRDEGPRHVFVLTFNGDIQASAVASLRESITAILTVARPSDEVLVKLESVGGTIHGYGLAASQLRRIRDKGIALTVAVDKVAASGGYMMACVANRIIAAPFAIVGSIGVVAQLPNFNRLLKNLNIDFEQITAGEFKRTLTLFGENTDKGREKFREDIEEAHQLFKAFIVEHRPQVDIGRIATGEHWYGRRALDLKLVDDLRTSDDYLYEASQSAQVYAVSYHYRKSLLEKLMSSFAQVA
jgi:serine protease SohB